MLSPFILNLFKISELNCAVLFLTNSYSPEWGGDLFNQLTSHFAMTPKATKKDYDHEMSSRTAKQQHKCFFFFNFIVQVQHIEVSNWWQLASTWWRSQHSFSFGLVYSFEGSLQFILFIIHYLASRAHPHWRAPSTSSQTNWTLTFLSHLTPYYI